MIKSTLLFLFTLFVFAQSIYAKQPLAKIKYATFKIEQNVNKIALFEKDSIITLSEVIIKSSKYVICRRISCYGFCRSSKCTISKEIVPVISNTTIAISTNNLSVYPNPVNSNANITISWKTDISDRQLVEIYTLNAILVHKQLFYINAKLKRASFNFPTLLKGSYFLRVTDVKTKIQLSKVIIVL